MLKMQLITAIDQHFEALYAIYCESIGLREQKSKADLAAMVFKPNYRLLLARDDTSVVGFSIVFVADSESFCLLEYMAVDTSHRGGGVGSQLFEQPLGPCMTPTALFPFCLRSTRIVSCLLIRCSDDGVKTFIADLAAAVSRIALTYSPCPVKMRRRKWTFSFTFRSQYRLFAAASWSDGLKLIFMSTAAPPTIVESPSC